MNVRLREGSFSQLPSPVCDALALLTILSPVSVRDDRKQSGLKQQERVLSCFRGRSSGVGEASGEGSRVASPRLPTGAVPLGAPRPRPPHSRLCAIITRPLLPAFATVSVPKACPFPCEDASGWIRVYFRPL